MARASASAASIVSLISKTFFVSSALPTPSHAARRSRIIEPSPAASVAFDCAYSANCCLATCSLRSPSAASDSACARAISALSARSAASSPMAPSPSWSSRRDSSPAAMVDAAAARDRRSGSGCRWMPGVRPGVPRCGARRAGRGGHPRGGGRFPRLEPDGTFHKSDRRHVGEITSTRELNDNNVQPRLLLRHVHRRPTRRPHRDDCECPFEPFRLARPATSPRIRSDRREKYRPIEI